MQSVSIVEKNLITLHLKEAQPDIVISPQVGEFDLLTFYKAKELISRGEEAALGTLETIMKIIRI